MPRLFAVTRSLGPAWNYSLSLEQQDDWPTHAEFMNGLHEEGFVLVGGPLEGTSEVLLIIRANDANEIRARLCADVWTDKDLLHVKRIVPWTVRLGSLPGTEPSSVVSFIKTCSASAGTAIFSGTLGVVECDRFAIGM